MTIAERKESVLNQVIEEQNNLPESKRIPVWFLRKHFSHANLSVYLRALRGEVGKYALAQVA